MKNEEQENKSKYYVPKIEELHYGFDYEHLPMRYLWYLQGCGLKDEWIEETFYGGSGNDGESEVHEIERLIEDKAIRIKHLDRSDLESLGWKNTSLAKSKETQYYNIGEISLHHNGDIIVIHEKECEWDSCIFRGTIRNRSELKRILAQIGV